MSLYTLLKRKFQSLMMRNQILFIKIIAFGIGIMLIGIFYSIQRNSIMDIYKNSSKIILQKQDSVALWLFATQLNRYIVQKINSRLLLLSSVDSIYQRLQNYSVSIDFQEPLPCQDADLFMLLYQLPQQCFVCWTCKNQNQIPLDADSQNLTRLSRYISEYIFLFNTFQGNRLFYVSTADSQLSFMAPYQVTPNSFRPQSKEWFKNHLTGYENNPDQMYFFSQLYLSSSTYTYKETMTYSLIDQKSRLLKAVVATDIDAEDLNLKSTQANTYFYNNEGQIIFRNVDLNFNLTQMYYIYQENATGFNQNDWAQIENFANKQPYTSNCELESIGVLCRYNTIFQSPIKIVSQKVTGNFTLMMFTNTSFQQVLDEKFEEMQNEITEYLSLTFQIFIAISIGLILISMLVVICIFYPIHQVMAAAQLYIAQMGNNLNKEIFKMMNQNKKNQSTFASLEVKILNFADIIQRSQQQKSVHCKAIESFLYPKKIFLEEEEIFLNQRILEEFKKSIKFSGFKLQKQISFSLKKLNEIHHKI